VLYRKNKKIPPFLDFKNNKKYTLVLGLENTLINVKIDNEGKVLCHKRPGLLYFLNGIKPFYEIISFTKLSKEYSDIINSIIFPYVNFSPKTGDFPSFFFIS
jgi:TFIIF-interacting CTD phosphatase-like protein